MLRVVRNILIVLLNLVFYGLALFFCVKIAQSGYHFTYDVLGETCAELPPGKEVTLIIRTGQSEYE